MYPSQLVAILEDQPSEQGIEMLRDAILPPLMCHAASLGKMSKLREAVEEVKACFKRVKARNPCLYLLIFF